MRRRRDLRLRGLFLLDISSYRTMCFHGMVVVRLVVFCVMLKVEKE